MRNSFETKILPALPTFKDVHVNIEPLGDDFEEVECGLSEWRLKWQCALALRYLLEVRSEVHDAVVDHFAENDSEPLKNLRELLVGAD